MADDNDPESNGDREGESMENFEIPDADDLGNDDNSDLNNLVIGAAQGLYEIDLEISIRRYSRHQLAVPLHLSFHSSVSGNAVMHQIFGPLMSVAKRKVMYTNR